MTVTLFHTLKENGLFSLQKKPQGTYAMSIRKNTGTLLQCVAAFRL